MHCKCNERKKHKNFFKKKGKRFRKFYFVKKKDNNKRAHAFLHSQPMNTLVLVFAKSPKLGTVKTRLACSIGNKKALWIYEQLLHKTQAVLKNIPHKTVLFYSGKTAESLETQFSTYEQYPQQGVDLGARMQAAFQWGFDAGYTKIIILGTDLWELEASLITTAFELLEQQNYVIGPATDGGYYLLGMKEPTPVIFAKKKWSTSSVLKETLSHLKGKSVGFLDEKNDLDTLEDLKAIPELYTALKTQFDDQKD